MLHKGEEQSERSEPVTHREGGVGAILTAFP